MLQTQLDLDLMEITFSPNGLQTSISVSEGSHYQTSQGCPTTTVPSQDSQGRRQHRHIWMLQEVCVSLRGARGARRGEVLPLHRVTLGHCG